MTKTQTAFKNLEKIGIERNKKLEELRATEADQQKALQDWIEKYDKIHFDKTVPAVEVAANSIEIDRAHADLRATQSAIKDLEYFGTHAELDAFRELYNSGMSAILKESENIDFDSVIKGLKTLTERLKKTRQQIIEYHNEMIRATGSGAAELEGAELLTPISYASIEGLESCIDTLEQARQSFNMETAKIDTVGVCSDWSGWAALRDPMPEDCETLTMANDYSPHFRAGQTVYESLPNGVRGRRQTRKIYNAEGMCAWIPDYYVYGSEKTVFGY